jgi:xylan 1,4-beta-xylosidase
VTAWERLGGHADWPDGDQWDQLAAAAALEDLEPPRDLEVTGGRIELRVELPMPAISLLELTPA